MRISNHVRRWDHLFVWTPKGAGPEWPVPIADPWIALAAIALATKRVKIGPLVTPLPRRRPWQVVREAVTLDHLSHGRLILGVGIGSDEGGKFSCFGEMAEEKLHGDMLDEELEVLSKLWSGEMHSYEGKHYHLLNARFLPAPLQQPSIPVWVAGAWPNKKPFRRAARWDGVCASGRDHELTPQDVRELRTYVEEHRDSQAPFEIATAGRTTGSDRDIMQSFADAGLTWWQEEFDGNARLEDARKRIQQGPPIPTRGEMRDAVTKCKVASRIA